MKYNFILAIDETSKDEINELVNILADNKIKFHVLKSDNELIESKKYKEVIDKAILELANIDGNLSNSQLSDRICNLIDILEEQSANSINKQVARGIGLVNQQKQFIEYLEEPIKIITDGNPTNISEYTAGKLDALKEILSKYKEIIGEKE